MLWLTLRTQTDSPMFSQATHSSWLLALLEHRQVPAARKAKVAFSTRRWLGLLDNCFISVRATFHGGASAQSTAPGDWQAAEPHCGAGFATQQHQHLGFLEAKLPRPLPQSSEKYTAQWQAIELARFSLVALS
jgi:hypothetical protein